MLFHLATENSLESQAMFDNGAKTFFYLLLNHVGCILIEHISLELPDCISGQKI